MRGAAVSRVLASKSSKVKEGDLVVSQSGWTEVAIVKESMVDKFTLPNNAKVTDAISVLGMTGLTAFFGLEDIGKPKAGETVVVSGAAGATGSIVGQIAKISGARVVGIAGSDDKCAWLRDELGFDVAINYKSSTFTKDLEAATPDYINVYWDNVGGTILEAALNRAARNARFVMCGSISGYNTRGADSKGIRNLFHVVAQRIRMEGFIVFDYASQHARGREQLAQWLSEGKIKRKETIVTGGITEVEKAFTKLFDGTNTGKLLLEVKPYDVRGSKL
jgi:NADPH-dependent curcumin reductase CurA